MQQASALWTRPWNRCKPTLFRLPEGKKSGEHLVLDALNPNTSRRPILIAQEAVNNLKAAQALFRLNAGDSVLPA